jgi:hypothetical protein
VVVLTDEYDVPGQRNLGDPTAAENNREILKEFYSALKYDEAENCFREHLPVVLKERMKTKGLMPEASKGPTGQKSKKTKPAAPAGPAVKPEKPET